jgi:hypothetical protein
VIQTVGAANIPQISQFERFGLLLTMDSWKAFPAGATHNGYEWGRCKPFTDGIGPHVASLTAPIGTVGEFEQKRWFN